MWPAEISPTSLKALRGAVSAVTLVMGPPGNAGVTRALRLITPMRGRGKVPLVRALLPHDTYAVMASIFRALVMVAALLAGGQVGCPEQGVRIIVGFPPGVAPDVTARLLADKFGEAWGKPVVVENVTG